MNDDNPTQPYCDWCEKAIPQPHRRHAGIRYCHACYVRIFKRRACASCGKHYREHPTSLEIHCRVCRPNFNPCIRCERLGYKIGKLTAYGPVCHSCAKYFVEEKICSRCGRQEPNVAAALQFGTEKLMCRNCRQDFFNKCDNCGRKRHPLVNQAGKKLCKKCSVRLTLICPDCQKPYPAGVGSRCKDCLYTNLLKRKVALNSVLFRHEYTQEHFKNFSNWLAKETSVLNAVAKLVGFLDFFSIVDLNPSIWFSDVDSLAKLPKGAFRKDGLPRRYFETQGVNIHPEVLNEVRYHRTIIEAVTELSKTTNPESSLFSSYAQLICERFENDSISRKTAKQALSTARSFMEYLKRQNYLLSQGILKSYLATKPGQRASLYGFITFAKQTPGLSNLVIPRAGKVNDKAVIKNYMSERNVRSPSVHEVRALLRFCHRVPEKLSLQVQSEDVVIADSDLINIHIAGKTYRIPLNNE